MPFSIFDSVERDTPHTRLAASSVYSCCSRAALTRLPSSDEPCSVGFKRVLSMQKVGGRSRRICVSYHNIQAIRSFWKGAAPSPQTFVEQGCCSHVASVYFERENVSYRKPMGIQE